MDDVGKLSSTRHQLLSGALITSWVTVISVPLAQSQSSPFISFVHSPLERTFNTRVNIIQAAFFFQMWIFLDGLNAVLVVWTEVSLAWVLSALMRCSFPREGATSISTLYAGSPIPYHTRLFAVRLKEAL